MFRSYEEQIATSYNCNYEDFNTEEVAKEFAKIRQLQKEPYLRHEVREDPRAIKSI